MRATITFTTQTDYRNGVRWWQFDPTKWLISVMSWVGLASNLKRVPDFKIQEAVVNMQFQRANERLKKAPFPNMEGVHELLEKSISGLWKPWPSGSVCE